MRELFHQPLSPFCRKIRVALAEKKLDYLATIERVWEERPEFVAFNPACTVPALRDEDGTVVVGASAIPDYIDETYVETPMMPAGRPERLETRRLVDWFDNKFHAEVTARVLYEKVNPRYAGVTTREGAPNIAAIRGGLDSIRRHLDYLGRLADDRRWLAGDQFTWADLAAAAQLSAIDYIGDVPWSHNEPAKTWFMRIKSRPSFRAILADLIPGVAPARHYTALDF